jgi:hypothetical protein
MTDTVSSRIFQKPMTGSFSRTATIQKAIRTHEGQKTLFPMRGAI